MRRQIAIPALAIAVWIPGISLSQTYDSRIAAMIGQVTQAKITTDLNGLTGVTSVTVGGVSRTITTRNTGSTPLSWATQWMYERCQAAGLTATYESWASDRNVVCSKTGTSTPSQIFVITCHIDATSENPNVSAPGADDNGSGTVALVSMMEAMASHSWAKTIRFIWFTGEEQGLYGSTAYVAAHGSDNIVGQFNMDTMGYDGNADGLVYVNTRQQNTNPTGYALDVVLANMFVGAASTYSTGANAQVLQYDNAVTDNYPFWQHYSAGGTMAVEDGLNDRNPYQHTTGDTVAHASLAYLTANAKTAMGAVAHLIGLTDSATTPPRVQGRALMQGRVRVP